MKRVIFDMNNPNTLVSLAYIKANKNPLEVFCNYILYSLLVAPTQSLRADELKESLSEKFGLLMPQQMINSCVRILKRNGEISFLPNGAGYAIGDTKFNITEFEEKLRRLQKQEETVLKSLTEYVFEHYKISWSSEEAKTHLSLFLGAEGNGARLFLHKEIEYENQRISPSWYVGRYITHIQKKDSSLEKAYLEEIVNGMMIYNGVYQTNDYQQDKDQKFKGTVFYFDTKLLLRALGYSWDAHVQSAKELIQLITKEYGGKVGVFRQTLNELENALRKAGEKYDKGGTISNPELRIYAELNPTGASLMSEASTAVESRLKQEFGIEPPDYIDWNSEENKRNSIATTEIVDYIYDKHKLWRKGTIVNDVEIINQINILRKGDYTSRYGGKKRLPVFVTTNTNLVYTFRDYVSENVESDETSKWRINALPVVSDNMILFRLWVPVASQYSNLPALTLARYAHSAQNPDTQFFEKLRSSAIAYQKEKGIDLINLSELRRQQLEDILIVKTEGNSDLLTEDMVATSLDELIKMENISLHNEIDGLVKTVGGKDKEITKKDQHIIKLISKPFINKIGISRLLILFARMWWLITTAILYVFADLITQYVVENVTVTYVVTAIPIVVQLVLAALDKWFDKKDAHNFALKWAVGYVWKKYVKKIKSRLSVEDKAYEEQVIEYCLNSTKVFSKYKRFCQNN